MAFNKKGALIPVVLIGIGAVVSHFLPSFFKPTKAVQLIPETQEWKKWQEINLQNMEIFIIHFSILLDQSNLLDVQIVLRIS